ncbi:MAG: carbonic anhydrase [Patescibacteria group bacterium]
MDQYNENEKLLDKHMVGTVVVACIDFRFRAQLQKALLEACGVSDYDLIKLAGGAKNISSPDKDARREIVFDDIALALRAHHANKIILLNHQNCGKYASEGHVFADSAAEKIFHEQELRRAGELATSQFGGTEIVLGYVWVGDNDKVAISLV